jgi:hypothetical protein
MLVLSPLLCSLVRCDVFVHFSDSVQFPMSTKEQTHGKVGYKRGADLHGLHCSVIISTVCTNLHGLYCSVMISTVCTNCTQTTCPPFVSLLDSRWHSVSR